MTERKEKPNEEEIARMLESFQAKPGMRFQSRIDQAPWMPAERPSFHTRLGRLLTTRRNRLAAAGILVCLLIGAVLLTPEGRATAVRLFAYFQAAGTDQQVLRLTPASTTGSNLFASKEYFSLTIDEAESQAGFPVWTPGPLPEGFDFTGARYDPGLDAVTLLYSRDSQVLLFTQRKLGKVDESSNIGASAVVEQVPVRETTGEYVKGGWRTLAGTRSPFEQAYPGAQVDLGMEWDSQLSQAILRWQEGEFAFVILANGIENLDQSMMISFAEGMNNE